MREQRVTTQFIGRLGNNMFQAAAALGYARKYNVGWGVPNVSREVPNLHKFFPGLPIFDSLDYRRYNRTDPALFNYEDIPFFRDGVRLVGFFQSLKYFEHCQDEVKELFKLDINPVEAVSIHVRRGDYVKYSNSFPPVNDDYLLHATDFMDKMWIKHDDGISRLADKAIVFSDDIEWCRNYFKKYGENFEICEEKDEFKALSLMASCQHHIIANSTFSWWGAYLGHNPNKIIVSPHYTNWFGPGFTGSAPKDLIPEGWHQIKFR